MSRAVCGLQPVSGGGLADDGGPGLRSAGLDTDDSFSFTFDKAGKVAFVQVQENTKEERNWGELQAALKKLG
jgi:hypothetical protein